MRPVREKNPRLAFAMIERRHTNRSLAKAAGVTEQTISRALNLRQEPNPETKASIARVLGVSAVKLFGEGGVK